MLRWFCGLLRPLTADRAASDSAVHEWGSKRWAPTEGQLLVLEGWGSCLMWAQWWKSFLGSGGWVWSVASGGVAPLWLAVRGLIISLGRRLSQSLSRRKGDGRLDHRHQDRSNRVGGGDPKADIPSCKAVIVVLEGSTALNCITTHLSWIEAEEEVVDSGGPLAPLSEAWSDEHLQQSPGKFVVLPALPRCKIPSPRGRAQRS